MNDHFHSVNTDYDSGWTAIPQDISGSTLGEMNRKLTEWLRKRGMNESYRDVQIREVRAQQGRRRE